MKLLATYVSVRLGSLAVIFIFPVLTGGDLLYAAQQTETEFNIPSQSLSSALTEVGAQAKVQILFDEALVKGLKAPAVKGRSTAQAAINQLLRDTGLAAVSSAAGTFTIQRAKQSSAQPSLVQSSADAPATAPKGEQGTFTLPTITVVAEDENTMRAEMERDLKQTKSVTGVSGQELQNFNPVNAFDALRVVPGVNYLFGGGTRNAAPTTIRGAAGTPTPKIIDDFPSIKLSGTGADRANTGFSNPGVSIPSIAIESVEVLRGSQGVLYGESAEGGVFSTRIKRGRPGPPTGTFHAEVVTLPETLFMGDFGGGTKKIDYYVAMKRFDQHGRGDVESNSELKDRGQVSGVGKFGWNPRENLRIEVLGLGNYDAVELRSVTNGNVSYRPFNNLFVGGKLDHQLSERLGYQLGYSFWREQQKFENDAKTSFSTRTSPSHTPFASLYYKSWQSDTWNHTSSLGWEYAHASIEQRARSLSGGVWSRSDKDFSFNDNSLFHIQQLHYRQTVFLNAGVRYTHLKELGHPHHASYEFGAAYVLPWTKTKLRANYSTGYSRNASTVFFNSSATAPVSFDDFGVTETRSWEVGFDQPLFSDKLLFQFTYYELDKQGQARSLTVPGTSTRFFVNDDNSIRKGFELYMEARPLKDLRFVASLATIDTKFTAASGNPNLLGLDALPTSDLTAALGGDWLATPKLRVGTLAVYQSEQEQQRLSGATVVTTKRPSYWRWNAWAEYAITPAISAGVRIENILNVRDLGMTSQATGQPPQNSGKDPGTLGAFTLRYRW